ncbi:hypothetical protein F511_12897 [Dorcoceras hygrometricum]|uniref:Uncharacterized protein n=1 Tax=Dorcoceras hygrometricum TaxID=472368 RepID=A0A2Z7CT96_9LAMI|nr:hypothetical protein F511_12897 [Dorcoceras hygrometricum]
MDVINFLNSFLLFSRLIAIWMLPSTTLLYSPYILVDNLTFPLSSITSNSRWASSLSLQSPNIDTAALPRNTLEAGRQGNAGIPRAAAAAGGGGLGATFRDDLELWKGCLLSRPGTAGTAVPLPILRTML